MFLLLLSFDYCSTSFVPESEVQLQHNIHLDELPCLSIVSLVSFVKLQLIIRLCNLSNQIIDNYSFQRKGLIVLKYLVISSVTQTSEVHQTQEPYITHCRSANIRWFERNDNRHHWWFY